MAAFRVLLILSLANALLQCTDAAGGENESNSETGQVFACRALPRSSPVPTSVHNLRPSDINVVAALGDSMTAGTGVTSKSIVGELVQNRGLSWSGGGQGTMEEHLTMPNILKKYNKDLYGFATGDGNVENVRAHFNLAVPGAVSGDLVTQATHLVAKMKEDQMIDFVNDWKLITILIGNNDLCRYCKQPDVYNEAQFYENLVRGLDVLHSELPRTLVSLVEPLNMRVVTDLNQGVLCSGLHYLVCECAAFPKTKADEDRLRELTAQYQRTVKVLAVSGRYDTRQDFTVVHQPFFNETYLPIKDNKPDLSYFAPDCFHMNAKGQAAAALALWNNMVSPVQEKWTKWTPGERIKCSSEDRPYIYTNHNSVPRSTDSPAARVDDDDINHFPVQLLTAITVCGFVVIVIGSVLFIAIYRHFRKRDLYVQIPQ